MKLFIGVDEEVYVVGKYNEDVGEVVKEVESVEDFVKFFRDEWGFEEGERSEEDDRMEKDLGRIWDEFEEDERLEKINIVYVGGYVNSYEDEN